jgi:hypothetical protein
MNLALFRTFATMFRCIFPRHKVAVEHSKTIPLLTHFYFRTRSARDETPPRAYGSGGHLRKLAKKLDRATMRSYR